MNKMVDIRTELLATLPGNGVGQLVSLAGNMHHGVANLMHALVPGREMQLLRQAEAIPEHLKGSVMLLGNFDGFHRGHRALLAAGLMEAERRGCPVAVMSVEPHPRQFFAPASAPFRLSTPATKAEAFSRLGVDFLFSPRFDGAFAGQEPEDFVGEVLVGGLAVSHLVVGHDFRFGRQRRGDVSLLRCLGEFYGFSVTAIKEIHFAGEICSSSRVRNFLTTGDVEAANQLLGSPWSVQPGRILRQVLSTGEGAVEWDDSLIKPASGSYEVGLRRAGESHPVAYGRLHVALSGKIRLALEKPLKTVGVEQLVIDFYARVPGYSGAR